jgi:tetratricopeptide (TPR) repeat protein
MFRVRFLFLNVLCLLIVAACSPEGVEVVSETDEKQYQLGQDYKSQGRMEEALEAFQRVINVRRVAPESHLEAGYIYLRTLKDPVRAIYHFDRYLQHEAQSPQATQVRQLIETAQKEFARQLPAQPYEGDLDRVDMMDLVRKLKEENNILKRDLISATARAEQLEKVLGRARRASQGEASGTTPVNFNRPRSLQQSPSPIQQDQPPSPGDAPRNYIVQSGDTLIAISRRVYGTPSRWIDIYQANRDRLPSESALRVGQEIRIP